MDIRLAEVRRQWEKGLTVKCVLKMRLDNMNVVLQGNDGRYHCHTYFPIGADWQVSADRQGVELEEVWKWLENPKT